MLPPAVYRLSIDNEALMTGHLHGAVNQIYIGDSCGSQCQPEMRSLKVLVRTCVPVSWSLGHETHGILLNGENANDFADKKGFQYVYNGTCPELGLPVFTYWKQVCLPSSGGLFEFRLTAHPTFPPASVANDNSTRTPSMVVPSDFHNTQMVLLVDDKQLAIDFALVNGNQDDDDKVGPPSEIEFAWVP